MQTATHSIEVQSHGTAMDWSLVLASQGIEHTIERREDAWMLLLASDDEPLATAAIRAYERENATVWRHEVKWTGLLFDWRSAFWWLFVVATFVLSMEVRPELQRAGWFDSARFMSGEWWRAFTAVMLHADVPHLALNASTGFVLLGLVMGCFGVGRGLLAALLAGATANMCEAFLRFGDYKGLGASGMVMAALGLLAAQSMFERHTSAREWIGRGVLAACLLLVLIGFDVRSDVLAHLLGFVMGTVAGVVLCLGDRQLRRFRWADVAAGVATAIVVVTTWALAISNQ
ncbi:MAG TPA: rhomboid family intramembrane serine protease [Candidatus Acidoferrum sp.]|nr:rhomboid family intramembrane serine protease [Candidatus Acidoferrum sp.]